PNQRELFWLILCLFPLNAAPSGARPLSVPRFEVTIKKGLMSESKDGRLFVILTTTNDPEPRLWLGHTGPDAPIALARDVIRFAPGITATLDQRAFTFPTTNLSEISTLTESGT